jgi:SAM-dependent methyltransferase/glycosyltransferase involved in cell wall biosynthesis
MPQTSYDEDYYKHYRNQPYERSEVWLKFFSNMAQRIVADFAPETVLDAGCAIGMLVEALRGYGVDAQGFDISDYAIAQAPAALKPYLRRDDIRNPNAGTPPYDLVVCIEVMEHLSEAEVDVAVANLCTWSDAVLFSSSPIDFAEPTHQHVQNPGYWAEKFAAHGLILVPTYNAGYITHWAMLFRRRTPTLPHLLRETADVLWEQRQRAGRLLNLIESSHQHATVREELAAWRIEVDRLSQTFQYHVERLEQAFAVYQAHAAQAEIDARQRLTDTQQHDKQQRIAIVETLATRQGPLHDALTEARGLFAEAVAALESVEASDAALRHALTEAQSAHATALQAASQQLAALRERVARLEHTSQTFDRLIKWYEWRKTAEVMHVSTVLEQTRHALSAQVAAGQAAIQQARQEAQQEIARREAYIADLAGERNALYAERDALYQERAAMAATFAWRLRTFLIRVRQFVFPAGSKHERVYFLTRTSLGTLLTKGPFVFVEQARRWLDGERRHHIVAATPTSTTPVSPAPAPAVEPSAPAPTALSRPALPPPTPESFSVIFIGPGSDVPSRRYRVYNMQERLRKAGIRAEVIDELQFAGNPEQVLGYHIIVFARIALYADAEYVLTLARERGCRLVYEIDDLVFDPTALPQIAAATRLNDHDLTVYLNGMAGYRDFIRRCDYFIGSTQHLAEAARPLGVMPYVVRNGLSDRQAELANVALQRKRIQARFQRDDAVILGYLSGSPTHIDDFAVIVPALVRILREFPQVRLTLQGHLDTPDALLPFADRIEKRPFVHWEQLIEETARLDVNLAPLELDNAFTASKSALKYFEAAVVEVPTVATPIEDFALAIRHGETGLLATTSDDWYACLHLLITDSALRQLMGEKARQDALERYTSAAQSRHTLAVYQHLLRGEAMPADIIPAQRIGVPPPLPAATPEPLVAAPAALPAATPRASERLRAFLPVVPDEGAPGGKGVRFTESRVAHQYLDGLRGLEINAGAHNPFGLRTRNVGVTALMDADEHRRWQTAQIDLCGTAAEIDIPGFPDDIPVADDSQDFVVHSHVWQMLANPLGALEEWCRVLRDQGYLLVIIPKRDSAPPDRHRPITAIDTQRKHHAARSTHPERAISDNLIGLHYTVFSPASLREIAEWFNGAHSDAHLKEIAFLESDDKVGNGHLIVWQVSKTPRNWG